MRYFSLLDFQYTILLFFLGLTALILIYVAFESYILSRKKQNKPEEPVDYPEGIQVRNNGIPPILLFIYGCFVFWVLGYVIVIGLRGGAF